MTRAQKVPVDARALLQRINRKLKHEMEAVKKSRGRTVHQVGEYYRLNLTGNFVIEQDVDLEGLGRELGGHPSIKNTESGK